MKKKIISLFLAVLMVILLLPVTAFAATDYSVWVNDEQFTSEKMTITCGDGTATLDTSTTPYTLTLTDATITKHYNSGDRQGAIYTNVPLNIVVKGVNRINLSSDILSDGIYAATNGDVNISGDGKLYIDIDNDHQGIWVENGKLNVEMIGGYLEVDCGNNGIQAKMLDIKNTELKVACGRAGIVAAGYFEDVNISGCKLTVYSGGNCIESGSHHVNLSDCNVFAESVNGNGIKAGGQTVFTDCVTDISTKQYDVAAIESKQIYFNGTGKAKIRNQASTGYAISNDPWVYVNGKLSEVVFSGITYVAYFYYNEADYTMSGSTGGGYTFKHTPAIYVSKVTTGGAAVEVADPVRGKADNARQLYTVSPEFFDATPTLKVEWKQEDNTWGDDAPADGLALTGDGKVTTTSATPAGSYTFRVVSTGEPVVASAAVTLNVANAYSLWVNGEQFSTTHKTIACGDGTATLDTSSNPYILTLDNATITNFHQGGSYTGAIFSDIGSNTGLNIVVKNTCAISLTSDQSSDGIYVYDSDLKICGDGTLDITLKNSGHQGIYGRYSDLTIAMDDGTLKIDCGDNGISAGDVIISGTDLTIKSSNKCGIWAGYTLSISNGDFSIDSKDTGLYSNATGISLSNGTVSIKSSGTGIDSHLGVNINNCITTIHAGDKCVHTNSGNFILGGSGSAEFTTTGYYAVLVEGSSASMWINGKVSPVTISSNGTAVYAYPTRVNYSTSDYTVIGAPDQKTVTYTRKQIITVKRAQTGEPAADVADPVYGTKENARQLFNFTHEFFSTAPTLKVEWKQEDGTWSDEAPADGLSLTNGGKVTTTSATPAGSYVFRVTNGEPEKIDDPASETTPKAQIKNPAFVSSGEKTLTVAKAAGSGSVTMQNWTYGGTASAPSPTSSTNGTTNVTYKYKVKDAEDSTYTDTKPTNAGAYTVKATFAATENYAEATATADFTINKATPTVNDLSFAPSESLTYDGNGKPATISPADGVTGLGNVTRKYQKKNGDAWNAAESTAPTVVGTYKVSVDVAEGDNYISATDLTSDSWTFEITKAVPTVTAPTANILTYTGDAQALVTAGTTSDGTLRYKLGESGTYSMQIPTAKDAGKYTVYYKVVGDSNHNDTDAISVEVTIAKQEITVSGITAENKVYDGTTNATLKYDSVTLNGIVDGESLDVTATGAFENKNVGTGKTVTISNIALADVSGQTYLKNYELASSGNQDAATADITAKPVTVSDIVVADKVYNNKTDDVTITSKTLTGMLDGDDLTLSGLTGTYASAAVSDAQTVNLNDYTEWTLDGGDAANYVLAAEDQPDTATGKITALDLRTAKVAVDPIAYDYTGSEIKPTPKVTFDGTNDIPETDYTVSYANNINAGTATVTVTAKSDNVTESNRTDFTIAKLVVTITPDANQKKTYGEEEPAFTFTNTDLCGSDTLTGALERAEGENYDAEGYAFKLGTLEIEPADNAKNYELKLADGASVFMIEKKPVIVKANDKHAYVGAALPELGEDDFTVTGLVNGDVLTTKPTLAYNGTQDMKKAGSYPILVSNAVASNNYEIIYEPGTLTVSSYPDPAYRVAVADTENGSLRVSAKTAEANTVITVTAVPDAGFLTDAVTVTGSDGKSLAVNALGDGKYSFRMPSGNVTVSATFVSEKCQGGDKCPASKFTDVDVTAWYHDGVHYCVENCLMVGVADTKFDPTGDITRGMIVTMLWRLEGKPVVNYAMSFTDVPVEQWYTEAVRWAASEKIVNGYDTEHFGPEDPITREQLATILYNYTKSKGQGFESDWMFLLDFVDRADISSWADEAVHWCSMKGIVNGKDGKVFDPQGTATRAEAATMVQRFCETLEK